MRDDVINPNENKGRILRYKIKVKITPIIIDISNGRPGAFSESSKIVRTMRKKNFQSLRFKKLNTIFVAG